MNWIYLKAEEQLAFVKQLSKTRPQIIFKHSTRCSISDMAKSRLERNSVPENIDFYLLDLLKHRNLSNIIASDFMVEHQSPQVLLIKDEQCVYDESHSGISMDDIITEAS